MGERIAAYFATVDATVSEIDWHLFPIATQRMMPVVLMVTRKAVQLRGFGNVSATRETFKRVRHNQMHMPEIQILQKLFHPISDCKLCIFNLYGIPRDLVNQLKSKHSSTNVLKA